VEIDNPEVEEFAAGDGPGETGDAEIGDAV
jgi:hypothetical protein